MDAKGFRRFDRFGQQHPRIMLLATVMMGAVATVLLLSDTESTAVLYQAF